MFGVLGTRKRFQPWRPAAGTCIAACVLAMSAVPAAADTPGGVQVSQWPLEALDAQGAWEVSKGEGVTVAVIDSGVEATHPDLDGQVTGGGDLANGASGDGTHDAGGQRGHGTQVASLVAGSGDNYDGDGLSGLAPEAEIVSFGVYEDGKPDPSAVAKAIRLAADRGAEVVLAPAGGTEAGPAVMSAVRYALDHDAVVVAGVGATSGPTDPMELPATPGVVAVTAVDREGHVWPDGQKADQVVLAAPGVEILAASSDGTYWTGDDTGFAAAWVAATAALVRSAHPDWSAAQTIERLIETARRTDAECDQGCGYGVVSPVGALTAKAVPTARTNPLLSSNAPSEPPAAESPMAGVPWNRVLVFVALSIGALVLYLGVATFFIRRQNARTQPDVPSSREREKV